jgi:hypothetical protein
VTRISKECERARERIPRTSHSRLEPLNRVGIRVGQCVSPAPTGRLPAEERAGETHCPALRLMGRVVQFGKSLGGGRAHAGQNRFPPVTPGMARLACMLLDRTGLVAASSTAAQWRVIYCDSRNRSQAAKVPVDELLREAFGVRPACWRCRKAWGSPKAGASSTHSKRFAQFGCGFASSVPIAHAQELSSAPKHPPLHPPQYRIFALDACPVPR